MKVQQHLLTGVDFIRSPNVGGMMTPTGVIMHYTADWDDKQSIRTLTSPATKVSAHLVIDRDGKITQLVPFNRVAWHAGPSILDGKSGCNNFTIGIEFVNPGYFRRGADGAVYDWQGKTKLSAKQLAGYDLSIVGPNARLGGGNFIWPGYTQEQIDAGKAVFAALIAAYGIKQVASHEQIDTRKWKTDPGPAFPMGEFKTMLHRTDDRSDGGTRVATGFLVNTPKLNVRTAPNSSAPVITALTGGSEVAVIKDLGVWSLVEYAPGKQGYLSDQYLKKAA
jgi:N-acetylmuramoyl-L-alanine amidase